MTEKKTHSAVQATASESIDAKRTLQLFEDAYDDFLKAVQIPQEHLQKRMLELLGSYTRRIREDAGRPDAAALHAKAYRDYADTIRKAIDESRFDSVLHEAADAYVAGVKRAWEKVDAGSLNLESIATIAHQMVSAVSLHHGIQSSMGLKPALAAPSPFFGGSGAPSPFFGGSGAPSPFFGGTQSQ